MIKVTEYERIAVVNPTQLGQIECPKCSAPCNERSHERRSPPGKRREWDCRRCGRGWVEVPAWVRTVEEAHQSAERDLNPEDYKPDPQTVKCVKWRDGGAIAQVLYEGTIISAIDNGRYSVRITKRHVPGYKKDVVEEHGSNLIITMSSPTTIAQQRRLPWIGRRC